MHFVGDLDFWTVLLDPWNQQFECVVNAYMLRRQLAREGDVATIHEC